MCYIIGTSTQALLISTQKIGFIRVTYDPPLSVLWLTYVCLFISLFSLNLYFMWFHCRCHRRAEVQHWKILEFLLMSSNFTEINLQNLQFFVYISRKIQKGQWKTQHCTRLGNSINHLIGVKKSTQNLRTTLRHETMETKKINYPESCYTLQ